MANGALGLLECQFWTFAVFLSKIVGYPTQGVWFSPTFDHHHEPFSIFLTKTQVIMTPISNFRSAQKSLFLAVSKVYRGGGMLFSLQLLILATRLSAQSNCDNFEFLVCQEVPQAPWPSYSNTSDPSAFQIYYRVYLKTKNGAPLPQNYGFNYLAFSGATNMPNYPLSSQLNIPQTMALSQQIYNGPGMSPYLQYLDVNKAGEVTWVVGDATKPCTEAPTSIELNPYNINTDRVLLFILVYDALSWDGVMFNPQQSDIVDCACSLIQSDDVVTCTASTAVVMPDPILCQSAELEFLPIQFDPNLNRYLIPVKIAGITANQIVQQIDWGLHIAPDMNGIALLDFGFFSALDGPTGADFRRRQNLDGSFDLYCNYQNAWIPVSNEAVIGFISVEGIFNLSQGGDLWMHLNAARFAQAGVTCGMMANDLVVTIPGHDACSSPISLTTDASFSADCSMSNLYTLTHTAPSSMFLDNLFLQFVFVDLNVPPSIPTDLPCQDCWHLDMINGIYVLEYAYDAAVQGLPFELISGTKFVVSFPGQTGCFKPFVFYAEAMEQGAMDKCALGVYLNDFPICDPRISVQFYSPVAGGLGVNDYKSKLENVSGSYLVENDDDCEKQIYCPDVNQAPYTLTAEIHNNNPLYGVSTFDLVRMSKHVLNVQPFTMPAQWVAADINKNGEVTTFDIVELRKLILGVYSDFPANQSWHYVDDAWAFPPNPIYTPPGGNAEYVSKNVIQNVHPGSSLVYKAIKVGDLTGDGNCGIYPINDEIAENRNLSEIIGTDWLFIPAGKVKAEPTGLISIPIFANGRAAWLGLQSGFRFDPALFEFVSVSPNLGAGISLGNFGLGKTEKGEIRFAWSFSDPDAPLVANEWLFTLQLKKKAGQNALAMNEWLTLDHQIMKSEAYSDKAGEVSMAELRLNWEPGQNMASNTTGLSVHAAPNPFRQAASTVFINAIAPGEATIELTDLNGKTTSSQQTDLQIGENRVQLGGEATKLPAGIYLLVVHQNGQRACQRIVKI